MRHVYVDAKPSLFVHSNWPICQHECVFFCWSRQTLTLAWTCLGENLENASHKIKWISFREIEWADIYVQYTNIWIHRWLHHVCLLPVLIRFFLPQKRRKTTGSVSAPWYDVIIYYLDPKTNSSNLKMMGFQVRHLLFPRGSFSNSMVVFGGVHISDPKKIEIDSPAQGVPWNEHISNLAYMHFFLTSPRG